MTFTSISEIVMSVVTKAGVATVEVRDGKLVAEVLRGGLQVQLFAIPVVIVAEILTAADAQSVIAQFVSARAEILVAAETQISFANWAPIDVAESVAALDSETAGRGLAPRDVPESLAAADTESLIVHFVLSFTESLTIIDAVDAWLAGVDNYTFAGYASDGYFSTS